MSRRLLVFGNLTTAMMFLVLVMGALVTNSGSADGCGNTWPLCHGRLIPEYAIETLIEYSHRGVAGIAGLMVVVLSIWSVRALGRSRPEVLPLAYGASFFVFLQALLGGAAVLWDQSATVLALHFGFSLLAFGGVLLLTVLIAQEQAGRNLRERPAPRDLRALVWATLVYMYGAVYLGAYVRHTNSSLACTDWPLCNGVLLPGFTGAVGIQFGHRLAALGLVLLLIWVYRRALAEQEQRPDLAAGAKWSLLLILLQILSGGYVVLSQLSLASTLLHAAVVSALFGALCYLCLQTLPEPAGVAEGRTLARAAGQAGSDG